MTSNTICWCTLVTARMTIKTAYCEMGTGQRVAQVAGENDARPAGDERVQAEDVDRMDRDLAVGEIYSAGAEAGHVVAVEANRAVPASRGAGQA